MSLKERGAALVAEARPMFAVSHLRALDEFEALPIRYAAPLAAWMLGRAWLEADPTKARACVRREAAGLPETRWARPALVLYVAGVACLHRDAPTGPCTWFGARALPGLSSCEEFGVRPGRALRLLRALPDVAFSADPTYDWPARLRTELGRSLLIGGPCLSRMAPFGDCAEDEE